MDLSTSYLGFVLPHPLMPGASPMVDDLDLVRRLEDAGAAAIVLHSLFQEQITGAEPAHRLGLRDRPHPAERIAFARRDPMGFTLAPDRYGLQVQRIKEAVAVPVIASLNGDRSGDWLDFARLLEEAGADALELNLYGVAADPDRRGEEIETEAVDMVRAVKAALSIPVAVKLAPFYTSLANLARRLVHAGADGLVLFNRFYQPDIDLATMRLNGTPVLSGPGELLLRLRWLAALSGRLDTSLAVSGGVHTPDDVVKAVLAGAQGVQVVSALLAQGPEQLAVLRQGLTEWLDAHGHASLAEIRGRFALTGVPQPGDYERAGYVYVLQQPPAPGPRRASERPATAKEP